MFRDKKEEEMEIVIKSRWDSTVLFTCEAASILLAVQAALKSGANLHGADLRVMKRTRASISKKIVWHV